MSTHVQRGMGAEDYCTCDGPWPCTAGTIPDRQVRAVLALLGPNGLVWDGEPVVRCADVYAAIAQVGHYPDDPRCIHWTLDQPVSHDIYCPICRAS